MVFRGQMTSVIIRILGWLLSTAEKYNHQEGQVKATWDLVTSPVILDSPRFNSEHTKMVSVTGACCPLCAGMLRVLFDKEKLDTIAKVRLLHKPDTVESILLNSGILESRMYCLCV